MRSLSRDDILKADDLPRQWVATPEWAAGDAEAGVYVRVLTGSERDHYEAQKYQLRSFGRESKVELDLANNRARLCALCMCDAAGKRLFEPAEAETLGQKSALALDRVYEAAIRLNGLSAEGVEDAKKNSGAGPDGESSSP